MQESVERIRNEAREKIASAETMEDLEELRVRLLGRKSPIQQLLKGLGQLSSEERPLWGQKINALRDQIEGELKEKLRVKRGEENALRFTEESLDVTLPGVRKHRGEKHLVTRVLERMVTILQEMGFSVQDGPDIESDYYNFEALNFPPDHPARDMQDTFYLEDGMVLRTQTSNIQARVMETTKPPIRIICPGRAFRNEAVTARSATFFHQIEGFYVDEEVTFSDLLATLSHFLHRVTEPLLGKNWPIRYRPSYFPFVEPGMEVDIACSLCRGDGCGMCKETGWVEVLGAGMVHREVLKNGGINPEKYSGYAWGLGVERFVNLLYGVDDIRHLTNNDLRFLQQFARI